MDLSELVTLQLQSEKKIKPLGCGNILVALKGTARYAECLAKLAYILTLVCFNRFADVKVKMGFLGFYTLKLSISSFNDGNVRDRGRTEALETDAPFL